MEKKVVLISIDGMRPDAFLQCGNPFAKELMDMCSYSLNARTVVPAVTLPCHMSMFHSVTPDRHGVTTNLYSPPVRPIKGLFEKIEDAGGKSAMFYGWEHLREVARCGNLRWAEFIEAYTEPATDGLLTDSAIKCIEKHKPDFVFLYMVETDEKGGHDSGWMTETYLSYVSAAIENVKRVIEATKGEYTVIITADHGGKGRGHGYMPPIEEDLIIPMFFYGKDFASGKVLENVEIIDIPPTIADVMGVDFAPEWEGKSLKNIKQGEK